MVLKREKHVSGLKILKINIDHIFKILSGWNTEHNANKMCAKQTVNDACVIVALNRGKKY